MSDPLSITAGAIGIAAAVTACIDCFNYVQSGRHFGRDYETCVLLLEGEKVRLARWGEAIQADEDAMLKKPDAKLEETEMAKRFLLQILVLLADTEKLSKKHKPSAKAGTDLSTLTTNELDLAVVSWTTKIKEMSVKRQKNTSFLKRTVWAIYHKSEFEELITNIRQLIDNLEMFTPVLKTQPEPAKEHSSQISSEQSPMGSIPGHQYVNVAVDGMARIGDTFSGCWQGAQGASHTYHGVVVKSSGKAFMGNNYGGKGFWDD
ncbi:small s protein [Xylaria bambusicola]|uniref:small s protein n=1 Tax=Xylaria bambusicola TaxID=326684 RepID=UPI002008390D|nr:small s protein [Xylaria bambusicola]KAI0509365.1 small s protein [Xylaria bambusicola]